MCRLKKIYDIKLKKQKRGIFSRMEPDPRGISPHSRWKFVEMKNGIYRGQRWGWGVVSPALLCRMDISTLNPTYYSKGTHYTPNSKKLKSHYTPNPKKLKSQINIYEANNEKIQN